MIPYFYLEKISIGPVDLRVWGFFVALGIVAGTIMAIKRAKPFKIGSGVVVDIVFWSMLAAFAGGKAVYMAIHQDFSISTGFSSIGAVVFSILVALYFSRKHGILPTRMLLIFAPSLLLAETVGRVGCFLLHEHPGRATNFFLSVDFAGVARHDLGLYFFLSGLLGLAVILLLEHFRKISDLAGVFAIAWYFFARFFLEFLYENGGQFGVDKYAGLTLTQYIAAAALVLIVIWTFSDRKSAT